jgi:hypothetical protein
MPKEEARTPDDPATCMLCGNEEDKIPLIPLRYQGGEAFICPRCLPRLIHPERQHQN